MAGYASIRIADYRGVREMAPHRHDEDVICLPLCGTYVERTRGRETVQRRALIRAAARKSHSFRNCLGRAAGLSWGRSNRRPSVREQG